MGFKDKIRGIFKNQPSTEPQKEAETPIAQTSVASTPSTDSVSGVQKQMELNELITELDKVSMGLIRTDLGEETIEKYSQMLNHMKTEISGLQSVLVLEELYNAMYLIISRTFSMVLQENDDNHVNDVKKTIHEGITALVESKKKQLIASASIYIMIAIGEKWVTESHIKTLNQDRRALYGQQFIDDELRDEQIDRITVSITSERKKLEEQEREIATLLSHKRDIEIDSTGEAAATLRQHIDAFITTLPTQSERIAAIEMMEEHTLRLKAKMRSDTSELARALGMTEEELRIAGNEVTQKAKSEEDMPKEIDRKQEEQALSETESVSVDAEG